MHEQAIAKLQALKAAPGVQMHWQEQIDSIIADLSAPPAPPVAPDEPADELEEGAGAVSKPKAKVTTAASVAPAKMKGKK